MSNLKQPDGAMVQFDSSNLFREETFTDLRSGTITRLSPVKVDGSDDPSRTAQFIARTQIMTEMGVLPIEAPMKVVSLQAAIEQFPQAVEDALEDLARRIEQRQREASKRIVTPDQLGGMGGMGGPRGGGGGLII